MKLKEARELDIAIVAIDSGVVRATLQKQFTPGTVEVLMKAIEIGIARLEDK